MKHLWLQTFWRWFFEAIDNKNWQRALELAKTIEVYENANPYL